MTHGKQKCDIEVGGNIDQGPRNRQHEFRQSVALIGQSIEALARWA